MSVEDAVRVMVEETEAPFRGRTHATEGGVRSAPEFVVVLAIDEVAEMFPAPSKAETA